MINSMADCILDKSIFKLTSTLAAIPSDSLVMPNKICSVPICFWLNLKASC